MRWNFNQYKDRRKRGADQIVTKVVLMIIMKLLILSFEWKVLYWSIYGKERVFYI
jgi:hypothetical protein